MGRRALPARHAGRAASVAPASSTCSSSCSCTADRRSLARAAAGAGVEPATLGGAPLVTTMHQVVEPSTVDRAYTRLHRVAAPALVARPASPRVQAAITRASAATIVHEEPFRRILPDATVIPHGIEDVTPIDRAAARPTLGLDDRFVVLCFGFLAPYKGIELVLEAAAPLAADDVQVVVAGGEHPRMVERRRLRRRAARALRRRRPLHRLGPRRRRRRVVRRRRPVRVPVPQAVRVERGARARAGPRHTGAAVAGAGPLRRRAERRSPRRCAPGPLARRIDGLAADPAALAELRHWSRRPRRRPPLAGRRPTNTPALRGGARWRPSHSSERSGKVIPATRRSARRSARPSPTTTSSSSAATRPTRRRRHRVTAVPPPTPIATARAAPSRPTLLVIGGGTIFKSLHPSTGPPCQRAAAQHRRARRRRPGPRARRSP